MSKTSHTEQVMVLLLFGFMTFAVVGAAASSKQWGLLLLLLVTVPPCFRSGSRLMLQQVAAPTASGRNQRVPSRPANSQFRDLSQLMGTGPTPDQPAAQAENRTPEENEAYWADYWRSKGREV